MTELKREGTAEDLKALVERLNADFVAGGGTEFGMISLTALRICEKTLENAPTIDGHIATRRGSAQEAALKIRDDIDFAKRLISEGNADMAARIAWDAAVKFAKAEFEFQWKADAERGRGTRASASQGGRDKDREKNRPMRQKRFARIRDLKAKNVKGEALWAQLEQEGLGKAGTIRGQWYAWQRKNSS